MAQIMQLHSRYGTACQLRRGNGLAVVMLQPLHWVQDRYVCVVPFTRLVCNLTFRAACACLRMGVVIVAGLPSEGRGLLKYSAADKFCSQHLWHFQAAAA